MDDKIVEVIEKYQTEQICDIFIKRNLQIFCRYAIYFSLTASNILQLLTKLVYKCYELRKIFKITFIPKVGFYVSEYLSLTS